MILYALTSMWGRFKIKVTEITDHIPARVKGVVIERYDSKGAFGYRADADLIGKELDVGIINVRLEPW